MGGAGWMAGAPQKSKILFFSRLSPRARRRVVIYPPALAAANGPRAPFAGKFSAPPTPPLISITSHSNHTFKTLPITAENTARRLAERSHKSAHQRPGFFSLTGANAVMFWRGRNGCRGGVGTVAGEALPPHLDDLTPALANTPPRSAGVMLTDVPCAGGEPSAGTP